MENMPKSLQVEMIRDCLRSNSIDDQLIDIESEIDGSLPYPINLEHIREMIRAFNGEIDLESLDDQEKDKLHNEIIELREKKTPKTRIVKQFVLPLEVKPIITSDNSIITFGGSYDEFKASLSIPQNILIVGRQGSGKSVVGSYYADYFKGKKDVYYKGFPKPNLLPKWIKPIKLWWELPNNSFVFDDEGDSQEEAGKKNSLLTYFLERKRQKGLTIMFESKNSALINLNIIRLLDVLLIKEPSLLQQVFERRFINQIIRHAKEKFNEFPKEERIKWLYVYSDVFIGMVKINKPEWFTDKISEAWA